MRLLRASGHRVMPWKNGGGSTTEIAAHPEGAGLDEFDWRVSMATVAADGLFSCFPGIDRTLAVLSGAGIDLSIDGRPPVRLGPTSEPFSFAGDVPTFGALVDGPIVDLNVMSRRGRIWHRLSRYDADNSISLELSGEANLIVARSDHVTLSHDGANTRLGTGDAVVIAGPDATATITPGARHQVTVFAISFMPADRAE